MELKLTVLLVFLYARDSSAPRIDHGPETDERFRPDGPIGPREPIGPVGPDEPMPIRPFCRPWSRWSPCSGPCGRGIRTRNRGSDRFERAVEARRMSFDDCSGGDWQTEPCYDRSRFCIDPPTQCVYGSWGAWGLSATCGNGVRRTRTRRVVSQWKRPRLADRDRQGEEQLKGLEDLEHDEDRAVRKQRLSCTDTKETNTINLKPCPVPLPVNCVYSAYTEWSTWSATCGLATRRRTRRILVQGANGGIRCNPSTLTSTETIRRFPCPTMDAGCNGRRCGSRYCMAYTDPHFWSFDRTAFDYQGSCKHYLVKPCGTSWDSRYPRFEVLGENPKCAVWNNRERFWPSCVGSVELHIPGTERSKELTISIDARDTVRLNNAVVTGSQTVRRNGYFIDIYGDAASHNRRIETSFGLRITRTLDGTRQGKVIIYMHSTLAAALMGKTCGICGQHNYLTGDDDFTLPNGANYLRVPYLSHHLDYTYSLFFRVTPKTPRSCTESPIIAHRPFPFTPNNPRPRPRPEWRPISKRETDTSDRCAIINLENGPFSKCHHNQQRMILYNFCLNDLAVSSSFLCESLAAYASICGQDGPTGDWRRQTGCPPLTCGQNAVYTTATHPDCMPTCYDPNPCGVDTMNPQLEEGEGYEEGCVCKKGFVYNGKSCVDRRSCRAAVKPVSVTTGRTKKGEYIESTRGTSTEKETLCMGLYGLRKQTCFESFGKLSVMMAHQ